MAVVALGNMLTAGLQSLAKAVSVHLKLEVELGVSRNSFVTRAPMMIWSPTRRLY
jgi:hypothetical protein